MNYANVQRTMLRLISSCTFSRFLNTINKLYNRTDEHYSPGWTWTGLAGDDGTDKPKPHGAWTAEETILYMFDKIRLGDFYILVPDNETKREVDQLRIMWGAADVAEGRPALSRWHKDYKPLFEEFVRDGMAALE